VLDWGGTGRPLIFLTGLGNNAHVYDKFAPKFTAGWHVYGITRRGFGASSAPKPTEGNYAADRLGDDVLAVMDALKLERPVLVGHSIAGEELSSIGSRDQERVAGLIYLDAGMPYAFYDASVGDNLLDAIDARNRLNLLLSGTPPDKKFVAELQASVARLEKDLDGMKKDAEAMPAQPSGQSPLPAIGTAIIAGEQRYTKIPVPVLAIFAVPHNLDQMLQSPTLKDNPTAQAALKASDLARTTAHANSFETGVPTAHVVRLANADHYVFLSNEADVLREMNAWLATVPK
jgi:non-heme chloroperoxidase